MKPIELRLAQEHLKASRHLKNLETFIGDSSRFDRIPVMQRTLMLRQKDMLRQYVDILEKRLENLGIPI